MDFIVFVFRALRRHNLNVQLLIPAHYLPIHHHDINCSGGNTTDVRPLKLNSTAF